MRKIDSTVLAETKFVALVTLILSALLQSVFLIIGKWDYTVLLGNLLGAVAAVGNFFLMGLGIQSAVLKEEDDARKLIKLSQSLRLLMLFVVALLGYILSKIGVVNLIAVVIPYLFPRLAVFLRPLFNREK